MKKHWLIGIGVLGIAFSTAALAKDDPCKGDVEKLCKGVRPGGGRIIKCLQEHESELSSTCKAAGDALKQKIGEIAAACKGDAEKFCTNVKPGEGRIAQCLKQHEGELSQGCKDAAKPPSAK